MKSKKQEIAFAIVATLLLIAIGVMIWRGSTSGVKVWVRNETTHPIKDLKVSFTGGSYSTGTLPSDTTIGYIVNPSGESSVVIEYQFADVIVKTNVGEYLERNYRGHIDVAIAANGLPNIRKDVRVAY